MNTHAGSSMRTNTQIIKLCQSLVTYLILTWYSPMMVHSFTCPKTLSKWETSFQLHLTQMALAVHVILFSLVSSQSTSLASIFRTLPAFHPLFSVLQMSSSTVTIFYYKVIASMGSCNRCSVPAYRYCSRNGRKWWCTWNSAEPGRWDVELSNALSAPAPTSSFSNIWNGLLVS